MKILLTGVTGYIAQRLLPVNSSALWQRHDVPCGSASAAKGFNQDVAAAACKGDGIALQFLLLSSNVASFVNVWGRSGVLRKIS